MSDPRLTYDTFAKAAPAAHAALLAMGKAVDESGLDKSIVELAKLRVSQINKCAFCLQIHLNVSRQLGIAQEKLDLVATWHEAGIFSDKECAALAWAELLTRLADRSVPWTTYAKIIVDTASAAGQLLFRGADRRQKIADALARGIRNFADQQDGKVPTGGVRR